MKPHPRIRKTIKWGGAAVSVLLVVILVGSWWSGLSWRSRAGSYVGVNQGLGRVWVVLPGHSIIESGAPRCWHFPEHGEDTLYWWLWRAPHTEFLHSVYLQFPLWVPAALASIASVSAWRLDTVARRRTALNHCPKCGYDRTGIAHDAKCPECGVGPIDG